MSESLKKRINKLKMHQYFLVGIFGSTNETKILRVPGGLIYFTEHDSFNKSISSCFVPYQFKK